MNLGKKQAFSLVELLVVIVIVGAWTAVAMPAYRSYKARIKASIAIDKAQDIK